MIVNKLFRVAWLHCFLLDESLFFPRLSAAKPTAPTALALGASLVAEAVKAAAVCFACTCKL